MEKKFEDTKTRAINVKRTVKATQNTRYSQKTNIIKKKKKNTEKTTITRKIAGSNMFSEK